ncbi:MAG: amidohydrolase family protein [Gemmatimonas sp.]|nr:amidohydrolase family protein [Gemmatimonas sp.]
MSRSIASMVTLLLIAACGGAQSDLAAPARAGEPVLFQGARLIIGDGSVVENGAFLVEGSTTTWVGPADDTAAPKGAPRVDLSGRTVIPALIDAHTHLGYEGYTSWGGENYTPENVADHLHRYAYYGVGAIFSAGTDPSELVLPLQRAQEEGELEGARLLSAAGMAPPGQGPNAQMLASAEDLGRMIVRGADTDDGARAAVREIARSPIPFIKIWVDDRNGSQEKLAPPIFHAIVDEATRFDIQVVAHHQNAQDMRELLRAGVVGFLHGRLGPGLDDDLASSIARHNAFVVPNLGLSERGRHGEAEDPFLTETLSPAAARQLGESFAPRPPFPESRERDLREAFQRLLDHDVHIVLGTDAGAVPKHFFGYSSHLELEIFVRLGMTPMQAIVAATSRPAEHLGLTAHGKIAPGMRADFVVLEANPLEDIRNTRRIEDVYLRGERIDRDSLRREFTGS